MARIHRRWPIDGGSTVTKKPNGVAVVPLRLSPDVVVYLVICRALGKLFHIETKEEITIEQAVEYAARRWHVPISKVTIEPEETINLGE